jgi:hypothetical protein
MVAAERTRGKTMRLTSSFFIAMILGCGGVTTPARTSTKTEGCTCRSPFETCESGRCVPIQTAVACSDAGTCPAGFVCDLLVDTCFEQTDGGAP